MFAAIKSGRPTPELLAYQYLQTLPQMAQGDANKVWIVPVGLRQGAARASPRCSAPPAGTGCSGSSRRRSTSTPSRPEDDDEAIKDWFDTSPDPEIARVVADAQAQARAEIPGFAPTTPLQATQQPPDQLPSAGGPRVGLPAAPQPPSGATPARVGAARAGTVPVRAGGTHPARHPPGRHGRPRPDRTRRRPPRRAPRQARVRDRRPEPVQGRGPRRGARRPRPADDAPDTSEGSPSAKHAMPPLPPSPGRESAVPTPPRGVPQRRRRGRDRRSRQPRPARLPLPAAVRDAGRARSGPRSGRSLGRTPSRVAAAR